jgi:CysZ protein
MILQAFSLSLRQLGDRRFRRVLFTGLALTVLLLVLASAGFVWLIGGLVGEDASLPFIGEVAWLKDLASWTSILLMLVLSVFLMVPVASAITSMWLDEVAQAVEDRHYPGLPQVPGVPFTDALRDTVNFLGVLIGANILALLFYVIFTPMAPFIFWALNGFLLGREYFTLAAMRRIGRVAAKQLRARHVTTIWIAGILMAVPLSIPLLNLLIPILGAATFTHIFHQLQAREAGVAT